MTNAVQLLQKLSISAVGKREKLLRVIKNPVTQYLPVNSHRIGKFSLSFHSIFSLCVFHPCCISILMLCESGFSHSSEKLVDIGDYVNAVSNDENLVFVVC